MPKGIVKAVVLVDDLDAVLQLLVDVVDAGPVVRFESTGEIAEIGLGWPPEDGATRGAVVGRPPGMLEIVEIPAALRASVRPGVAMLSFGVADVAARAERAAAVGYAVRGPRDIVGVDGATSTLAQFVAGGVGFEVIRFGTAPDAGSETTSDTGPGVS